MPNEKVWDCKIGSLDGDVELPEGSDLPMRQAVKLAYWSLTGKEADFVFSGWGGRLNHAERKVAENFLTARKKNA